MECTGVVHAIAIVDILVGVFLAGNGLVTHWLFGIDA
jgi:hypothetical protein